MNQKDYLALIDEVIAAGPYRADWSSLSEHPTPEWYRRAKLGIFIHWGIYSVPAFGNEWYSRNMYNDTVREFAHHVKTYGDQKTFGYKDFIPMFRGEKFDADAWVRLFKQAGARYIMPVAEHHDGFAMYDTAFNRWNSVQMGPGVDVMGQLRVACQNHGLQFCASNHRAAHYFFMNLGRTFDSDVGDEAYADFYGPAVYRPDLGKHALDQATEAPANEGPTEEWMTDWMVRVCEFVDKYQPKVLYFDWWIQNYAFKPYLKKIAAYYYNRAHQWGQQVSINYKREAFPPGVATFDVERGALTEISPVPWQTCSAIGKHSWGYITNNEFKTSRQIICDLIDIVSKNGMLLLNVGPRSDGTITEEETKVLQDLGAWLQVNGEGIYDTVPWKWFGEGSVNASDGFFMDGDEKPFTAADFRFTYHGGCLYAFWMRPQGNTVRIRTLASKWLHDFGIEAVSLLGSDTPVDYTRDEDGLHIRLLEAPTSELPLCFRIQLA